MNNKDVSELLAKQEKDILALKEEISELKDDKIKLLEEVIKLRDKLNTDISVFPKDNNNPLIPFTTPTTIPLDGPSWPVKGKDVWYD